MAIASPRFRVVGGNAQSNINPPCVECRHYMQGNALMMGGLCMGHPIPDPVHGAMYQLAYVHRRQGGRCGMEGHRFAHRRWWHPDERPGFVFGVVPALVLVAAFVAVYFFAF